MNEQKLACASIIATLALIALAIAACMIVKPAAAVEPEPEWTWQVYPSDHTNMRALVEMKMDALDDKLKCIGETETARLEREAHEAWEAEQAYYEQSYAPSYGGVRGDPNGLNSFVGVVDYNGTTETAYSSNVLYHYRTSEWTPDEYGFYRTSDGYYVVASSDYAQGTVIDTSRGEAMVLDSGCDSGVTDFYVNW